MLLVTHAHARLHPPPLPTPILLLCLLLLRCVRKLTHKHTRMKQNGSRQSPITILKNGVCKPTRFMMAPASLRDGVRWGASSNGGG